jgi:hypothetical protein
MTCASTVISLKRFARISFRTNVLAHQLVFCPRGSHVTPVTTLCDSYQCLGVRSLH